MGEKKKNTLFTQSATERHKINSILILHFGATRNTHVISEVRCFCLFCLEMGISRPPSDEQTNSQSENDSRNTTYDWSNETEASRHVWNGDGHKTTKRVTFSLQTSRFCESNLQEVRSRYIRATFCHLFLKLKARQFVLRSGKLKIYC